MRCHRFIGAAAVAGASLLLGACTTHRVTRNPAPPVVMPGAFAGSGGDGAAPHKWWLDFHDDQLNALIARTLDGNLQIRGAWARVRQAKAVVRQASAARFPQVQADLSGGVQRTNNPFRGLDDRAAEMFMTSNADFVTSNAFASSVGVGYEVDLWKRAGAREMGAALDAQSLRDDAEAMAITLTAEVTETWFNILAQRANRKLILEQLETSELFLELVRFRFRQGMASALDIHQQRQLLVGTRSRLALIDGNLAVLEHTLAILAGRPPSAGKLAGGDTLPGMPGLPGIGIPADLLDRRPDVRAARRRAEAADHRVAVAVADRLPSLRLSGSAGQQGSSVVSLFASPIFNIIGAVTGPLFDGGRRKAEVSRNKAVVDERLLQYGSVLLRAMLEVENALVQERHQARHIVDLQEQSAIAADTLREARARYLAGLIDYLPVLSALQAKQQTELGLLQAQRQLLSYRVQLCRALGGTWTKQLTEPVRNKKKAS